MLSVGVLIDRLSRTPPFGLASRPAISWSTPDTAISKPCAAMSAAGGGERRSGPAARHLMARPTPEIVQGLQTTADALTVCRQQLETVPLVTLSPLHAAALSLARTTAPVPPSATAAVSLRAPLRQGGMLRPRDRVRWRGSRPAPARLAAAPADRHRTGGAARGLLTVPTRSERRLAASRPRTGGAVLDGAARPGAAGRAAPGGAGYQSARGASAGSRDPGRRAPAAVRRAATSAMRRHRQQSARGIGNGKAGPPAA